jgi:hypothetical protein
MEDNVALHYALDLIANGVLSVDSEGRIWRHAILSRGTWRPVTPRRAESIGGKGYLRLMLQIEGRLRGVGAHRVIWSHVNGEIPADMQINHRDLNKQHNAPENLELVTAAGNIQHSYANGRARPWHLAQTWRAGRAKLSPAQIAEARAMRRYGAALKDIANHLGIAISHAHRITKQ